MAILFSLMSSLLWWVCTFCEPHTNLYVSFIYIPDKNECLIITLSLSLSVCLSFSLSLCLSISLRQSQSLSPPLYHSLSQTHQDDFLCTINNDFVSLLSFGYPYTYTCTMHVVIIYLRFSSYSFYSIILYTSHIYIFISIHDDDIFQPNQISYFPLKLYFSQRRGKKKIYEG